MRREIIHPWALRVISRYNLLRIRGGTFAFGFVRFVWANDAGRKPRYLFLYSGVSYYTGRYFSYLTIIYI